MEEQQERRKVGEEEGGQPSGNSGQTVPKHMEYRIMIDEISPRLEGENQSRNSGQTVPKHMEYRIRIDEISPRLEGGQPSKNWIESVEKAKERTQSQTQWPRIPKVPQILRGTQDFKKFYEPRVVSIGPYHHGKPDLQPMEMIKLQCANKFLPLREQMEALYKKIKSKIKEVRNCYDRSSSNKYDDEELTWMMLLDGCFLLQFICSTYYRMKGCPSRDFMSKVLRDHQINFVEMDLFLLENQLPYEVLKLIFKGAEFDDALNIEEMIKKFVIDNGRPEGLTSEIQLVEKDEKPSHLLDLLRSALLGSYKKGSKQEVGSQSEQEQEADKKGESSLLSSEGGDKGSQPEQEQEAEKKGESLSSGGGDEGSQPEQEQESDKKGESLLSSGGGDGEIQPEQDQEADKKGESSLLSGGGDGGIQPEQELQEMKRVYRKSLFRGGDGESQPEQEQQEKKKASIWKVVPPALRRRWDDSAQTRAGRDGGICCLWKKGKQRVIRQSFRHIKELKAAGIHLKPSRTSSLRDISFNSYFFYGYLKLPPIIIDDCTKPKFLNMVAYEMCPDAPDDYAVTSYICFLDKLIDHADDVKELRSQHILDNLLGSDEEVAKIFNEISNDLVDPDAYEDVKAGIQKHYDKRWNTWIAQALHDHFSTPWTITAFVAAVLILFLTALQTNYTVPGKSRLILYIFVSVTCVLIPCLVIMIRSVFFILLGF